MSGINHQLSFFMETTTALCLELSTLNSLLAGCQLAPQSTKLNHAKQNGAICVSLK